MKFHHIPANQKGFSLITIVLLFTILGVMTAGGVMLSLKLQTAAKNNKTVDKMTIIRDALQQYYRGHQEDFPTILTTHLLPSDPNNRIPVDALKLEQHFRYDAWGQFFHYDPGVVTDITDVRVNDNGNNKYVGAVIISSGSDQIRQSVNIPPYSTQGDDILVPVNLRELGIEISLTEMRVLQKKLRALALRCISPSPPITDVITDIVIPFALGDEFIQDAWLQQYIISDSEIRSSGPDGPYGDPSNSDDLVLSSLTVTCPGGLPQTSSIIVNGRFNEVNQNSPQPDMGSYIVNGQIVGGANRSAVDKPPGGGTYSLILDGSNNYVRLNSLPILDPGTGGYAISIWINVDVASNGIRPIYGTRSSDSTTIEFFVDGDPALGKVLVFRVEDPSGNYVEARSNATLSTGSWHHVVAVWESSSQVIKLYHQGAPYPATLMPGSPGPVGNLESDEHYWIGRDGSGNNFFGLIDEILIYNVAISDADVAAIFATY
ncbi:LamG-like jellyroll fold domain-containing protein [Desulfobacula sp.]|uniref:LamG-like jellyroll fold domain-containing protein n=1 Tax=Desulfobacula sp. TaxID=2593537 RepID=UPI00261D3B82|nr:LamG-like jellyroll fold domain-containing protein [Desulfobacula sp.]